MQHLAKRELLSMTDSTYGGCHLHDLPRIQQTYRVFHDRRFLAFEQPWLQHNYVTFLQILEFQFPYTLEYVAKRIILDIPLCMNQEVNTLVKKVMSNT
jgi:hypothetical protein